MKTATRMRAFERVALLGDAKLSLPDLFDEAGRVLAGALPRDAACWHAVDPVSLIETSYHLEDVLQSTSRPLRSPTCRVTTTPSSSWRRGRDTAPY